MLKELTTTKITPEALKSLRIISAILEENQYEVLDRLLENELVKVKEKFSENSKEKKPKTK